MIVVWCAIAMGDTPVRLFCQEYLRRVQAHSGLNPVD